MKTAKKLLVLLLTLLLVNVTMLTSFASVTPAVTEANAGKVVTVKFTYNNIAGIYGEFEVNGDQIFDKVEVTTTSGFSGKYNDKKGIIAFYNDAPANFVCTLKITLSSTAKVGDEAKITLKYETTVDGKLPSTPSYSYDTATIKIVPNLEELNRQITKAQALNKDDYTADSWRALDVALVNAINARNATTQEAVDAAAKALADAIAALQKKPTVDYSELLATIDVAKQLNKNDYTAASWEVFENALDAAERAKTATTQAAVDAATKTLKDAIAALEKKPVVPPVDYSELEAQIEAAKKLNKEDYTEASWEALEKALADAILARDYEAQPAVDAAAQALKEAIAGLVKKQPVTPEFVDYTKLQEQIDRANALDKNKYTEESWSRVEAALEKANALLNTGLQAEVDAAMLELKEAIDALVLKSSGGGVGTSDTFVIIPVFIVAALAAALMVITKKRKRSK